MLASGPMEAHMNPFNDTCCNVCCASDDPLVVKFQDLICSHAEKKSDEEMSEYKILG